MLDTLTLIIKASDLWVLLVCKCKTLMRYANQGSSASNYVCWFGWLSQYTKRSTLFLRILWELESHYIRSLDVTFLNLQKLLLIIFCEIFLGQYAYNNSVLAMDAGFNYSRLQWNDRVSDSIYSPRFVWVAQISELRWLRPSRQVYAPNLNFVAGRVA